MPLEVRKCPSCKNDVMESGFTLRAQISKSYMRLSVGVVQIASSQAAADKAECMVCGKALPWTPAEMMRIQ